MESTAIDVFHQHLDDWFIRFDVTTTEPTSAS
jgi:hypothetical protein